MGRLDGTALRETVRAVVSTRALIWLVGMTAVLRFGLEPTVSPPAETHPYGWLPTLLTTPATPWDAGHYVGLALHGYDQPLRAAFFPLYPLLGRALTAPLDSPVAGLLAISLAAFAIALYLLHRLVALEAGERYASGALWVVALFPTAFFFSALYTESLFLALSVGAFYAARRERWVVAGLCGALAAATRNTGVLLVVPLLLMPAAHRRSKLWVALVPTGLLAYLGYWAGRGDLSQPLDAQKEFWFRDTGPLTGAAHGLWDAGVSLAQLAAGPAHHVLATPTVTQAGQLANPLALATVNLVDVSFLVFAVIALVGAARRLPIAYAAYAAVALVVACSAPSPYEPLVSLPRYLAVLFPLQVWLAMWAVDRGALRQTLTISAAALALLSAEFATWRWVA